MIRGAYAYLDPNWEWRKVKYVADPETGFRILPGSTNPHPKRNDGDGQFVKLPLLPRDTPAVAKAKERHQELFQQLAQRTQAHRNVRSSYICVK